jgi:LemA protein
MKNLLIAVLVLVGLLILGGIVIGTMAASVNNELVRQQEAVRAAWSQVDIVLQRRADLIPNLVETVKGYAAHEKGVIDAIANARAGLLNAHTPGEKIEANGRLDGAIGRLLLVVENYPNLKADENFLRLQDDLAGSENRIAIERHKYNETLQKYNTTLGVFPNNIFAGMFGFHRSDDYFKTEAGAREVPKVNFGAH